MQWEWTSNDTSSHDNALYTNILVLRTKFNPLVHAVTGTGFSTCGHMYKRVISSANMHIACQQSQLWIWQKWRTAKICQFEHFGGEWQSYWSFIFDRINISTDPNRLLHCHASESLYSSHIFPVQPPDNFIDHQCSLTFSLCTIRDARTVLQTAYPDLCLVPDVSFFAFGRGYDPLPRSVAPASPHLL